MQSNKGVSMIMLIITVIMMAIIVSFAVFYSQNITPEAKLASAYSSMKTVKDACDNAEGFISLNPNEYDDYFFFGKSIHNALSTDQVTNIATEFGIDAGDLSERTYMIEPIDRADDSKEAKRKLENLELKGIEDTYIVDLDNKKYYLVGGIENIEGIKLYEYSEILKGYSMLVD